MEDEKKLTDIIISIEKKLPDGRLQIKYLSHDDWDVRGKHKIVSNKFLFNYALPYKEVDNDVWVYKVKRADEYGV